MNQLEIADRIARIAHAGQTYGGQDYYSKHILGVACRVKRDPFATYGHLIVALLHDTLEDTAVTADDLLVFGINDFLVDAIVELTKTDDESYFEYIHRVALNPVARLVKIADAEENLQNSTYGSNRHKRYTKALAILREAAQ